MIRLPPLPWTNVVVDLGTLGGPNSFGLAINSAGNVSGVSYLTFADPHASGVHAFRYVDGLGMIDVGTLPSGNFSWGQGINSGGLIVGGSFVDEGGDSLPHAFITSAAPILTDLGTLGGDSSFAYGVNAQGQVTGEAAIKTGDTHAFVWTSDGMRDIGTLGGNTSVGRSINESGPSHG